MNQPRCELQCSSSCRERSVVEVDDAKVREGLDRDEQEEDADRDAVPAQRSGCVSGAALKRCGAMVPRRAQHRACSRGAPVPAALCASRLITRVQGVGAAHCVGSKPLSSSAAGVGVAGVKSTLAAGAASSAFSPAVSSMRSLWSLRTPHVVSLSAYRWQCKEPSAVRALACKSRTHPCGRAGNTRLRLTRETPTGEYADEAASSAMSNIATRRAIAEVNDGGWDGKRGHNRTKKTQTDRQTDRQTLSRKDEYLQYFGWEKRCGRGV